jgi:signal transduction histidine kinase
MSRSPITALTGALRAAWELRAEPPRQEVRIAIAAGGTALVLAVVGGQIVGQVPPPGWAVALDLVVGLVGALMLPATLQRPLVAAVGFAALSAVSPAATPLAGTALLWLAQHVELRVSVPAAAAGVLGQVVRQLWRPQGDLLGWWLVAVVAGFAALVGWGAWSRARHQLLESLIERARRAEDEQAARLAEARRAERERIAREMHDVLAHRLSLLATYAGAVEYNRGAAPDRLVEAAEVIRAGAHDALADLRQVIDVLRTDDGEAADGGTSPPQPTLADLPPLVEDSRRAGVAVTLDLPAGGLEAVDVSGAVGRAAYRVVQEALTNVRKHAPGRAVRVTVTGRPGDGLVLEVRNPVGGAGSDPMPGSGTGLVGMAERVRLVGGELDAGPAGPGEFRVRARLPWPE